MILMDRSKVFDAKSWSHLPFTTIFNINSTFLRILSSHFTHDPVTGRNLVTDGVTASKTKQYKICGGIRGRNKEFGTKWRKHLDPQHYSCTARVVAAIEKYAADKDVPWGNAIEDLEKVYVDCKKCVANMVFACQDMGLLNKKASRGKFKKDVC